MSDIEIVFRIIEIIIASFGVAIVIIGWIIPYHQSLKAEKRHMENEVQLEKMRWRKELIDRQISELYGPMNALIIQGEISFKRILYQMGRNVVFPNNTDFSDLCEEDQKIWKHYVDTYKIPNQLKMANLLLDNTHLLYNSEMDDSCFVFLDYALGWELLDNQKRNDVPNYYQYCYSRNYPQQFNEYIRTTFEVLLKEQKELLKFMNENKDNPSP